MISVQDMPSRKKRILNYLKQYSESAIVRLERFMQITRITPMCKKEALYIN